MAQITDAKTSAITDTGAAAVVAGLEIKLRPENFSWCNIRGFPSLHTDIFKCRTYFGRVLVVTQLNRTSSQQIRQENYGMFPLWLFAGTWYHLIWDTCRSKKIRIWSLTQIVCARVCCLSSDDDDGKTPRAQLSFHWLHTFILYSVRLPGCQTAARDLTWIYLEVSYF